MISNEEPFRLYVLEVSRSYFAWKKHEIDVQSLLGTQRFDELFHIRSNGSTRVPTAADLPGI